MHGMGRAVCLLEVLLGVFGVVAFRVWSSPPSGLYVSPDYNEHSCRIAEAYSNRCLQHSAFFSVATHRRPGPMTPQEADDHIRQMLHIARTLYCTPPPVNETELRRVITAPTEQLPVLIKSSNSILAAHAAVEAILRGAKGCIPALAHVAMHWQPNGKSREMIAHRDLPYLAVHGIALLAGGEARPTMEPLLKARSSQVRTIAAYELSFLGDKRAIPFLHRAFEQATQPPYHAPNFRAMKIAMRLIALGDADTRAQAKYLLSKLYGDGRYLLPALAERRKPEILQFIRQMMVSREYHGVRKWAAIALGRIHDKKALPYLLRALEDPGREVAEHALKAIEQIGDASVVPQLRRIAERIRPRKALLLYRNNHDPSAPIFFADEILRVARSLEERARR